MPSNGENCNVVPQAIKVSAPGKVILHGEHSVVYGKRAVALSLNLRTHLTVSTGGESVSIDLPIVNIKQSWPLETFADLWKQLGISEESSTKLLTKEQSQCIRNFLSIGEEVTDTKKLALLSFFHLYISILARPIPLAISVTSQLPTGAGLGSSAAYAVCLAGALLHLSGKLDLSQLSSSSSSAHLDICKTVTQWAYTSEQIVHGTPSGIDNSVCTYGGAISFKSGEITPIQVPSLKVLLVNTGVPRSTKALVTGVRERRDRLPEVMEPLLDSLDAIANQGLQVLQNLSLAKNDDDKISCHKALDELVNINHALLCALGVSHASLDRIVSISVSHGLHAKLTGAGGGGFGIVVVSPSISDSSVDDCCDELKSSGYEVWSTSVGAPGLLFHVEL